MKRIWLAGAAVAATAVLAACGGNSYSDDQVASFERAAKASAPSTKAFTDTGDWKTLLGAVCDNAGTQTYGQVSKTVAAYVDIKPSSGDVDQIITAALDAGCPSKKAGLLSR